MRSTPYMLRTASAAVGAVVAALVGCSTSVRSDGPAAPSGLDSTAPRTSPATGKPAAETPRPTAGTDERTPTGPEPQRSATQPSSRTDASDTSRPERSSPDAEVSPSRTALPAEQVPEVTGTTSRFVAGTPDATLRAAFDCAMRDDFDCYAALNVRSNRDGEIPLAHLKNYQWRSFRARWQSYVVQREPFSVHITRRVRDPGKIPRIKLFLFSDERDNPAPCIFELQDGAWRIYANSL